MTAKRKHSFSCIPVLGTDKVRIVHKTRQELIQRGILPCRRTVLERKTKKMEKIIQDNAYNIKNPD
jgi:precorrin-6B methylase 1